MSKRSEAGAARGSHDRPGGHELVVALGHADTDQTSSLHAPDIDLVVAGLS